MTTSSYLSASVEASRLRRIEEQENFYHHASRAEWRAVEVADALNSWAPAMSAHHLGADKFIITVTDGGDFSAAFHLEKEKAFHHCEQLTPSVLYVRCLPPEERRSDAEQFVLEQVAIAFLPF